MLHIGVHGLELGTGRKGAEGGIPGRDAPAVPTAKTVGIGLYSQPGEQGAHGFRYADTHRQHHQIETIDPDRSLWVEVVDRKIPRFRVFADLGDAGFDVADPVLLFGPVHELVEILAEGSQVDVEDRRLAVG